MDNNIEKETTVDEAVVTTANEAVAAVAAQDAVWFNDALIDVGNCGMEESVQTVMLLLSVTMVDMASNNIVNVEYLNDLTQRTSENLDWLYDDPAGESMAVVAIKMIKNLGEYLENVKDKEGALEEDFLYTLTTFSMTEAAKKYGVSDEMLIATWGTTLMTCLLLLGNAMFSDRVVDEDLWNQIVAQAKTFDK